MFEKRTVKKFALAYEIAGLSALVKEELRRLENVLEKDSMVKDFAR